MQKSLLEQRLDKGNIDIGPVSRDETEIMDPDGGGASLPGSILWGTSSMTLSPMFSSTGSTSESGNGADLLKNFSRNSVGPSSSGR